MPKWLAVATGVLIVSGSPVKACGLVLDKPHAHFDGVDEQGHVLFVDTLGTISLGDGIDLPVYTMFRSDWKGSSPYVGQGWMVPLLESKIVQIDDNTFQMWQPDGWYQYLGRDKVNTTILNGQRNWKAEVNDDNTITAWAPCGWKMTYSYGKLISIVTPKNQVLELVYRDGKVVSVNLNGTPVVQVETNPETGLASSLRINNDTINVEEADKPILQNLNGQNVVGSVVPSLSKITHQDGKVDQFHFAVDSKLQPLLTFQSSTSPSRTFTWSPLTDFILKDNEWSYQITPSADGQRAGFSRNSSSGQTESWSNDPSIGQEVSEINGKKRVTTRFVSGKLSGLTRKIVESNNGVDKVVYSADYDEVARPIRIMDEHGTRSFQYDDAKHTMNVYDGSTWLWTVTYDDQKRVSSIIAASGFKRLLEYLPDNSVKETDTSSSGESKIKLTKLDL